MPSLECGGIVFDNFKEIIMTCKIKLGDVFCNYSADGRIYDKDKLKQAIDDYVERCVKKHQSFGELNHPERPYICTEEVSHIVTDIKETNGDEYEVSIKPLTTIGYHRTGILSTSGDILTCLINENKPLTLIPRFDVNGRIIAWDIDPKDIDI